MPAFAAVAFTLGIHEVVLQKAQKTCYNGSGTSEGVYSTETVTQNGVSIAVISGPEKRVKKSVLGAGAGDERSIDGRVAHRAGQARRLRGLFHPQHRPRRRNFAEIHQLSLQVRRLRRLFPLHQQAAEGFHPGIQRRQGFLLRRPREETVRHLADAPER